MTSMFRQSTDRLTVWLFALCLLFPFSKLSSAWRNTATQDKAFSISAVSKASPDSIMPERLTFPDSVALAAPETAGRSVSSLVAYLKQHLSTDDQLARAIYTWVSRNIKYNVYITYTSRNEEADETKEIQKILSERKGICQDYALLFKALVKEAGMDAYVIDGYNRRDGALLPDPHEWCAAKVSGKWYMFDPTWGAGFVENYQFIPSPNHRFCKLLPDTLLKTHMPFDPMFQFRERPLSYEEFDTGVVDEQRSVPVFYWADTLALYARQDTLERLVSVRQRMLSNGRSNDLVY
uniref:transglutaminase domain-containing protein n=2 Tax=Bacteroides TaxID=816 RepID=UPI0034A471F0